MAETAAAATPTTDGGAQPAEPQDPKAIAPETAKAETEPKKEEAAPEPRFYERKINGKAEKIPADVLDKAAEVLGLDPAELLRGTQLAKAAYSKFEEARKLQAQWEAAQKEDPWGLAKSVKGMTDEQIDEMAIQRVIAKMNREAELEKLTPEQRAYEAKRQEIEARAKDVERREAAIKEQVLSQQAAAVRDRLEPMIIGAIEKAGLPKTPEAVRAVVSQLELQHKYGIPLDVDAAVREAQSGFVEPSAAMLSKMGPEQLIKMLGKEAVDAILRHSVSAKQAAPVAAPVIATTKTGDEKPYMTPKELKARLDAIG